MSSWVSDLDAFRLLKVREDSAFPEKGQCLSKLLLNLLENRRDRYSISLFLFLRLIEKHD